MNSILLGMLGPWQIVLIAVVLILLFGARKIPQLMRGLGSGVNEFKKGLKDGDDEKDENSSDTNDAK